MLISCDGFHGHTIKQPTLGIFLPCNASYSIILYAIKGAIHSPCIFCTKAECQRHPYMEILQHLTKRTWTLNFSGNWIINDKRRNIFLKICDAIQACWFGCAVMKECHDFYNSSAFRIAERPPN